MSQNKTKWDARLESLETQVRAGELDSVRQFLLSPELHSVPRPFASRLANIARRAQRPSLSLKILQPLVRPKVKGLTQPNRDERLEYAYALQKVGAKNDAFRLLSELSQDHAKAHLALAFHYMQQWDYRSALSHLERLLGAPNLPAYDHTVTQVNRLACLVALEDANAEHLYPELERDVAKAGSQILKANIMEIMAQYWIDRRAFRRARDLLSAARTLIAGPEDVYRMLIEKWLVVADAMENNRPEELERFREKALALKHWETLRDLDYVRAKMDPSSSWAEWVYFGTPHAGFRERLQSVRIFPESCWIARDSQIRVKWDPWFVPQSEGEIVHRFVVSLLSDFYRPARVGEIFSSLFPDQYFDVEVSPNRIHQIASRARAWLTEREIPVRLEEEAGSYSLRWDAGLAIFARKATLKFTKVEFLFGRYREARPLALSSRDWAEKLGFHPEKCKRLLREASAAGFLVVQKKGPYSKYVLGPWAA